MFKYCLSLEANKIASFHPTEKSISVAFIEPWLYLYSLTYDTYNNMSCNNFTFNSIELHSQKTGAPLHFHLGTSLLLLEKLVCSLTMLLCLLLTRHAGQVLGVGGMSMRELTLSSNIVYSDVRGKCDNYGKG